MPFSAFCPSRRVVIAAALLLVLFMSFLLLLPEVVRRVMVYQLNERLVHPVRIGDVDPNPFTGNARAENLVIANTGSPSPLEQLASLDVGISYWGQLQGEAYSDRYRYASRSNTCWRGYRLPMKTSVS